MPPKTATATKLDFEDSAVINKIEELRKILVKVKDHESEGTEVSYVTFRGFEKNVALLKQISAMCRARAKAVPHHIRCLFGSAAELVSVVAATRKIDQTWVPEPEEIEELLNADPNFDLEAEITLPEESDGETSAKESPAPSTPDSFHFIRRSAAKAMASSKEASPDEKDRPQPKKKSKPSTSTIEEYSPVRQTSKQAPPTFQKPRGVKRQMEVEILTTPESTTGKKKTDTARPAKKAKTSDTVNEPKKGILKKSSTVTEPRTRRQHSRARSAALSDAGHEEEDGDSESRPPARTIKVDKGKKRARAPSAPPSNAGDVGEEEEDDDSSKTRRKSTRKEITQNCHYSSKFSSSSELSPQFLVSRDVEEEEEEEESTKPRRQSTRKVKGKERERSPSHDSDDEGPVFGPFVLPTIRETSTEPPVLIDHYKPSRYTVSFRQQKTNKKVHALSQGA
ncbi:hypothetical protein K435DRAFT_860042 [Dendrothele bispora CBS 962.96]|uniref:Uncharacterized protein n=1 Tax=Dendrothele bispora (strain CBS 962.96) TaxID=1314807 RepID=A0A4V4HFH4_DENBC|nr:hypothetical protein K435DRAFT_860042 [Dendrothele bispora CBS 962.96]